MNRKERRNQRKKLTDSQFNKLFGDNNMVLIEKAVQARCKEFAEIFTVSMFLALRENKISEDRANKILLEALDKVEARKNEELPKQ